MRIKIVWQLAVLTIILLDFFGLKIVHYRGLDYVFFAIILVLGMESVNLKNTYTKWILAFVFFVLGSCIYSTIFNGQRFLSVVGHSYPFFSILYFFVILRFKPTYQETQRILEIVAILFCLSYIIQWVLYPRVIFAGAEHHTNEDTAFFRMRLPGSIVCYYLFFYGINRYVQLKQTMYILYGLLGGIPIIIMGFRSLVILSVVFAFVMIPFVLKKGSRIIAYSIAGGLLVFAAIQTDLVQKKIDEMIARQQAGGTFENKNYVRWLSLDYYLNVQLTKPFEKVVGAGYPSDEKSYYFKQIHTAVEQFHFYWNDLGIVGLSMIIGIPAVAAIVIIYLLCIWRCKEPPLQCIRFTLIVVLGGSIFTTMELYRSGNILLFTLFLYMEYEYHIEQKYLERKRNLKKWLT